MTGTPQVTAHRSDVLRLPPHPLGPSVRSLPAWAEQHQSAGKPIAVDLFSGAGGLSAGIEAAGWVVAAAADTDTRALETHRHNFAGLALDLDLGQPVDRDRFVGLFDNVSVDLVAGGPPCQPFSRAGRSKIRSLVEAGVREKRDMRRELWKAFLDVALRLNPRAVLMENVPDMGLADDFAVVRFIVDELARAGYRTDVSIADASRYGVPQHRRRLIVLARRDGHAFTWPEAVKRKTTLRQSITDLPDLDGDVGSRELAYVRPDRNTAFVRRMRAGATAGVVHDHMTRRTRSDDREIFEMMTSKTLYSDIPERLRRYNAESFTDKYKRLGWDELSRSITAHIAKDGYWYIHPGENRTLTVREAARVQTFPDRFRFAGTRSDAFRQIGNAVPPMLAEAAARAVAPCEASSDADQTDWFAARQALGRWAHDQASTPYWFTVPGIGVTAPVALAAAALARTRPTPELGSALQHLRGRPHYTADEFRRVLDELPTGGRRAMERLRPLVRARKVWETPAEAGKSVGLNDSERRVYDVLRGEDVLLRSPGVLRIAGRIAGNPTHTTNRLTDGRIALARLVGSGSDAAARMAGLRVLAATTCEAETINCEKCPLAAWCVTAAGATAGTVPA